MHIARPGQRGCGMARAGFYLIGQSGPGGILSPVTMLTGTHTNDDARNLRLSLEPQLMHWIDPERTVDTCQLHFAEPSIMDRATGVYTGSDHLQIQLLGPYGVGHHVGKTHYTPLQHLLETKQYGPSCRVDKKVASQIVKYLPMRIFFHFSGLPYFDHFDHMASFIREIVAVEDRNAEWQRTTALLGIPTRESDQGTVYDWDADSNDPVWTRANWGGTIFDDPGFWHSALKVQSYIERNDDWPGDVESAGGFFYYSWITRGIQYVPRDVVEETIGEPLSDEQIAAMDHTTFLDPALAGSGIEAVVLDVVGDHEDEE